MISSGTENLYGVAKNTVVSALKSSTGFIKHDNGYVGGTSDCFQDLKADDVLNNQFDGVSGNGNVVQCGQIGGITSTDVTFTLALGYGETPASAVGAANGSLTAGFADRANAYRGVAPHTGGWNGYVNGLKAAPPSVSGSTPLRRAYYVAAMALRAAEDKGHPGASIAGFAQPWGQESNHQGDGYHRVWGRDLYQQATGLLADGDTAQALRMARFMWNSQYDGTKQSFPRFSPVGGIADGGARRRMPTKPRRSARPVDAVVREMGSRIVLHVYGLCFYDDDSAKCNGEVAYVGFDTCRSCINFCIAPSNLPYHRERLQRLERDVAELRSLGMPSQQLEQQLAETRTVVERLSGPVGGSCGRSA